jgi:hypothetical protein
MSKQIKARRPAAKRPLEIGPRELLLAGLGAVSLTRKQSIKAFDALVAGSGELRSRVGEAVGNASVAVNDGLYAARERVEGAVSPLIERAGSTLQVLRGEVEAKVAPVLQRLGVTLPARKPARRPAAKRVAKRATAKRSARKRA